MSRGRNNMRDSLNKLKEKDVYSMLLYVLYRLKDDEKYSTLSSLMWAFDRENLIKFLTIFEGVEMKVPSISDMKVVVNALQLYQFVNLENKTLDEALSLIKTSEVDEDELKSLYYKVADIMYE